MLFSLFDFYGVSMCQGAPLCKRGKLLSTWQKQRSAEIFRRIVAVNIRSIFPIYYSDLNFSVILFDGKEHCVDDCYNSDLFPK